MSHPFCLYHWNGITRTVPGTRVQTTPTTFISPKQSAQQKYFQWQLLSPQWRWEGCSVRVINRGIRPQTGPRTLPENPAGRQDFYGLFCLSWFQMEVSSSRPIIPSGSYWLWFHSFGLGSIWSGSCQAEPIKTSTTNDKTNPSRFKLQNLTSVQKIPYLPTQLRNTKPNLSVSTFSRHK